MANSNFYVVESMNSLINAVGEYKQDLLDNYKILIDAANACDVAMGSDALSARHIARLNDALVSLSNAITLTEEVMQQLIQSKHDADEIK